MAIDIVTSENRAEYMAKKLNSMEEADEMPTKKPKNEQDERAKKHPKYALLKAKIGKRGAIDAILKELNEKQ